MKRALVTVDRSEARLLCDLPAQDGFSFIGTSSDGRSLPCVIRRDEHGLHHIRGQSGEALYCRLVGWRPAAPQAPRSSSKKETS